MSDYKYEEYFIAFLDILGFKRIINSSSFEDVANIFRAIYVGDSKKQLLDNLKQYMSSIDGAEDDKVIVSMRYKEAVEKAKIYIMSDSIIIATPALYPESLTVVCDLCHAIEIQLLDMDTPILVRGAISKGEFYIGKGVSEKNRKDLQNDETDNILVFGKGLIDAYLAQENYAVVPRVIVSKKVQEGNKISLFPDVKLTKDSEDGNDYLPTIDIYLTSAINEDANNVEHQDISYYENIYRGTKEYKKLKRLIDKELSEYQDLSIRKKYVWLENEMNRIKKIYLESHGVLFMCDASAIVSN